MAQRAPAWVDPVMRVGYVARAIVYILVGWITLASVWAGSGEAEGPKGALRSVVGETWGAVFLLGIAVGLVCYAAWRLLDAAMDLEDLGSDAKGIVGRLALSASGLVYLSLAAYAASLLVSGWASPEGGEGTRGLIAAALDQPFGRWLVIAAGLAVAGFGIHYVVKALRESYKDNFRRTPTTEVIDPALKFGLVVHGIVVLIIAAFIVWAGWNVDPSQGGGFGDALASIRDLTFGRVLLGVVGVGLLLFALYCLAEARYRVIPRRAKTGLSTLGGQVRRMVAP